MKCYYEELGISQDADVNDIRTAYRKLALKWHPDKNLDRSEEAKERFQLIQQAYEVLSDPQERAWYDNHREQILRGKNSNYEDNCLDLFQYFTVSCFKGYGDDDKGFYAVYREVFKKIAAEDAEFMDDEDEVAEIPVFGDSQSSYEEVVGPFYAYWRSYCTKKSYAWLCPYDIQECKDRRVLRAIEKEMKKIVQNAKRERNEEVRNLVSFIRKRDKRVQAYNRLLEEKAELNRQKQAQNRREQMLKRQRELEDLRKNANNSFNEGYEEQLRQLEQQYSDSSEDEQIEEEHEKEVNGQEDNDADRFDELEDVYANSLFCLSCNKMFKNSKAFANHENSRKHRENVEKLKNEMLDEEEGYRAAESDEEDDEGDGPIEEDDELVENQLETEVDDISAQIENVSVTEDGAELEEEQLELETATSLSSKKNKKNKKGKSKLIHRLENSDNEDDVENKIHHDFLMSTKKGGEDSDDEDWANSSSKKNTRKNKNKKQPKQVELKEKEATVASMESSKANVAKVKAVVNDTQSSSDPATTHVCVTCKATFESKNKLFAHLKKTNHGVYIPKPASTSASVKNADISETKKVRGKRK